MAIESIGSTATDLGTNTQRLGLGQEDFLKILLTQLTFQDPLKPMDNQQFIAQMAQFTSLEQTRQMNDRVDGLVTIEAASQALGLIGKTVEVRADTGSVVGNVTTITFNGSSPQLTVQKTGGGFLTGVSLSQVYVVR